MKFHEIDISKAEEKYIIDALYSGAVAGRGANTEAVEATLEDALRADRVLMTTSGTHALEMAVRLSGIGPGDEVILPSFTFPSTANAVLAVGATPVLIPVDESTLSITSTCVQAHLTSKTKAVIAVHYAGVCHDIDVLAQVCKKHQITLIEDAAQAFGSSFKNKKLGTYGDYGCLSFHGTKNDVSGEGGALILPKACSKTIEMAERLLEKGTDRMAFMRGDKSTYEWKGFGSSYVPSDLLMALLRGQLESSGSRMEKRRHVIKTYIKGLSDICSKDVTIFKGFEGEFDGLETDGKSNAHLFYIIFKSSAIGMKFKNAMTRRNIPIRQHFVPLHISEMGLALGYNCDDMPFESDIFDRLYRLPVHSKMTDHDVHTVIESALSAIQEVLE